MRLPSVWAVLGGLMVACLVSEVMSAQSSAGGNPEAATVRNPVPVTPESIEAGRQVYQRNCRACHLSTGKGGSIVREGGPPSADLTDDQWDHGSSDGEIYYTIESGVPPDFNMEPWEGRIADTDVWNVINYIRTFTQKK